MNLKHALLSMPVLALLTLGACDDKKISPSAPSDAETSYASEYYRLQRYTLDAQAIADRAVSDIGGRNFELEGGCAQVQRDSSTGTRTVTIDFDAAGCLGADGSYRSGRIVVSYPGAYDADSGNVHTIRYEGYTVNTNRLAGTTTVTYRGRNSDGQPLYNVEENETVTLSNGRGTLVWTAKLRKTMTGGFNSSGTQDDRYRIEGQGEVTGQNGKAYQMTIQDPVQLTGDCRWIQSGSVNVLPTGNTVHTVNYGDGGCDASATVTVGEAIYPVTLDN